MQAIARAVNEQAIDILIMGAYAHSARRSLFLGSKTADLLRSATIPAFAAALTPPRLGGRGRR